MGVLILGLVLFLGVHSVRIVANDWRTQVLAQRGEGAWKGLYSLVSLIGLVLLVWGYGMARQQPVVLWVPPVATRHIAALLTLVAFILLTAPYVPRNGIKARLHHPMVLGVKVWAFAHLLANGNLADLLLFGSFLAWAVADSIAARRRDRRDGRHHTVCCWTRDATVVAVGLLVWMLFALWGHVWLIGVAPF